MPFTPDGKELIFASLVKVPDTATPLVQFVRDAGAEISVASIVILLRFAQPRNIEL